MRSDALFSNPQAPKPGWNQVPTIAVSRGDIIQKSWLTGARLSAAEPRRRSTLIESITDIVCTGDGQSQGRDGEREGGDSLGEEHGDEEE